MIFFWRASRHAIAYLSASSTCGRLLFWVSIAGDLIIFWAIVRYVLRRLVQRPP